MKLFTDTWFEHFPQGQHEPGTTTWLDDIEEEQGTRRHFNQHFKYYINHKGYRGKLLPEKNADAAFGCSYTFGYGVGQPWPELLGVVNCGVNGFSNDAIARSAIAYCNEFQPKKIYVMWTLKVRREHIDEKGQCHKVRTEHVANRSQWVDDYLNLMSDANDQHNYMKNRLLLTSYCHAVGIDIVQADWNWCDHRIFDKARDDVHPGPEWHTIVKAHMQCLK